MHVKMGNFFDLSVTEKQLLHFSNEPFISPVTQGPHQQK